MHYFTVVEIHSMWRIVEVVIGKLTAYRFPAVSVRPMTMLSVRTALSCAGGFIDLIWLLSSRSAI